MKEFLKKLGRKVTGRKGIGNTMTVVIIIAVVLLNVIAYTVTGAFGIYFYSPAVDDFSISGSTDELFAEAIKLGKKVTITFCYPEDKLEKHDTGSYVLRTAREYEARYAESGFINIRFVNLLTKMDENGRIVNLDVYCNVVCDGDGEEECGKTMRYVDVDKENPRCQHCGAAIDLGEDVDYNFAQNSVIFETGEGESFSYRVLTDKRSSAGFVDFYTLDSSTNVTAYNGEEVIAAMISWVLHKEHPIAYFTQNHGESAEIALTNLLSCAGYYVEVINLRKSEIPDEAGMVIISNPTSDFEMSAPESETRGEINKLEDYMKGGGKLYVQLDPYAKKLTNLEDMLSRWGITLSRSGDGDDALTKDVIDIIKENSNAITPDGYSFVATVNDGGLSSSVLDKVEKYGSNSILISQVARLKLDASLGAMPLLVSSKTSSTYAGGELTDNGGEYAAAAYSVRDEGEGKSSTVVVMPTAYITSTDAFLSTRYSNKDFLYATFEELFGSHASPRGCNQILYRTKILENLTMGTARIYTALILAIPTALAVVGVITITRRKNR